MNAKETKWEIKTHLQMKVNAKLTKMQMHVKMFSQVKVSTKVAKMEMKIASTNIVNS